MDDKFEVEEKSYLQLTFAIKYLIFTEWKQLSWDIVAFTFRSMRFTEIYCVENW